MSYSFYVKTGTAPALGELMKAVDIAGDLHCAEAGHDGEAVKLGGEHFAHLYRYGLSTRGVELAHSEGAFQARVMTASSEDEYDLALRLCEAVARRAGASTIEAEEGETFAVGTRGSFDASWVRFMVSSGAQSLLAMQAQGPAQMSGPLRGFTFGPRCAAKLQALAAADRPAALTAMMRRVQYPDDDVFVASTFRVTPPGGGAPFTMSVLGSDCDALFARVDVLSLSLGPKSRALPIDVPFETASTLLAPRWEWLSDDHALVSAVPEAEWGQLLARASKR